MESVLINFKWNPDYGTYLIAIESQPVQNEYDLSNNKVNTTVQVIPAPIIDVNPTSFSFVVPLNGTDSKILTISNLPTAEAELNYSISFSGDYNGNWLSANPDNGIIEIGQSDNVTITANTSGLSKGNYLGNIIVESNDINDPEINIPVNLSVILAHDVGAVSVNFPSGTVPQGSYVVNATVGNFGCVDQVDVVVNCTVMEGIFGTFLYEDFSGGFLPEGWSQEEAGEWSQHDGNDAGGVAPEAYLYWSGVNGDYACLDSKPVNTVGAPSLVLRFNHSVDQYTGSFYCRVLSRSDSGDEWVDVTPWSNPVSGDMSAGEWEVDISGDIGVGTQVRFEFDGDNYNLNDWYVDDVHVFAPSALGAGDVVFSSEAVVDVAALSEVDVLFSPAWVVEVNGFYAIEVSTRLVGDQQVGNDVVVGVVEVYEDVSPPVVSDVVVLPDPQIVGEVVNVSCVVVDESGVDEVFVRVVGPDGFSPVNVSMVSGGGDVFFAELVVDVVGNYSCSVWACDVVGNGVCSSSVFFVVVNESCVSVDVSLLPGWNLITVPVRTSWWASDLAGNVVGCGSVSGWDAVNQTYETFIVGVPESDFVIEEGCGYFVDVSVGSVCTMVGLPVVNVSVPLSVGWNLLGWYHEGNTTASGFAENISGCGSVSWWNNSVQTYDTFIVGIPESDFGITRGMGLFVDVNQSGEWNGSGSFSRSSFPPKVIFGIVERSDDGSVDGASVVVQADGFEDERAVVSDRLWQVDVGPDTGDEWMDGTSFTVSVSLGSWSGCADGVVKGTYTDVGTMVLKEVEIRSVRGGFLLSAVVSSEEAVEWEIVVEGNVLVGGVGRGMVEGVSQIRLPLSVGFGDVVVTVSVGSVSQQFSARMLGPFLLDVRELV
jgi:hypothetical protein